MTKETMKNGILEKEHSPISNKNIQKYP